jgi:hypothetical protein
LEKINGENAMTNDFIAEGRVRRLAFSYYLALLPWPIYLFLTHNDSREHVLHHTLTSIHSRPFPGGIPLPDEAVMITVGDYLRILGQLLIGKENKVVVTKETT